MSTRKSKLDPLLRSNIVEVEPEELLEPEYSDDGFADENPSRMKRLQARLGRYGNRVLQAGRHFIVTLTETVGHIGTALAGSIVLLPVVIIVRGVSVLADAFLSTIKPLLLSFFRAIFEVLRALIWPLHEVFMGFNKQILFPLIKRIKEDDVAALVALAVLVIVIAGTVLTVSRFF